MLSDTKIKNLKPRITKSGRYSQADSNGLTLYVYDKGSKTWVYRFSYKKKAQTLTLGHYPSMSLLNARQARDANRQLLDKGVNPKERKTEGVTCFSNMFQEWHKNKRDAWSSNYANDVIQRAECYLLPYIGDTLINEITTPDILRLLKQIEQRNLLDTLEKVRGIASRVFSYSVGMGVITVNPVRDLPTDIFKKKPETHYATITEPNEIGWLLNTLDLHPGTIQVKVALKLAPHLFLRPAELTGLLWSEVDFDEKIIRIGSNRMKMKKNHLVPMSKQVTEILNEFSRINFGSDYVFPTPRNKNKCITTNALLTSIRSLGISKETFTIHGFRHMASTRLNEMGIRPDVIERQLAHSESNKVRAVYNQAQHLEERKEMMQQWSDYLDKIKLDWANSRE